MTDFQPSQETAATPSAFLPQGTDLFSRLYRMVASLRLTVALLAMSMFIVLAGTVAQIDQGIWQVIHAYFRTYFAWIDLRIFAPRSWNVPAIGFYFPGGWLIGGLLVINLLAAHALRYRIRARGGRLWLGLLLTAAGVFFTWYVVDAASQADIYGDDHDPYWRVTIQLLRGTGCGLLLLAGGVLLFANKGGMALLHGGILLLMLNEFFMGLYMREGQMMIAEGGTVDYVIDNRSIELVFMDRSPSDRDDVFAVRAPQWKEGSVLRQPEIPFEVEIRRFLPNSKMIRIDVDEDNLATTGIGRTWRAVSIPTGRGIDSDQAVDAPSLYAAFREKGTGRDLGTWLLSVHIPWDKMPQRVMAGDRPYEVALRFEHTYKPYAVHLVDFRFDRYPGTNQPRNYSSDIRLIDPERNVDRKVRIWMNNPLRYRGDTMYQSSFTQDEKGTVLQVVTHSGWMVPYVSCMLVATGMLAQFGLSLSRFLRRRRTA